MDQVINGLPRLAIDTSTTQRDETIQTPRSRNRGLLDTPPPPPAPQFRRTDSDDSLRHLIRGSPNLAHVQGLPSLPSPITQADRLAHPFTSHGRRAAVAAAEPATEATRMGSAHGLLPPALFARLQKEHKANRAVSLSVSQDLDAMVMPRITRHKSQNRVDREDTVKAAPRLRHHNEQGGHGPGHALSCNQEEETIQAQCGDEWMIFEPLTVLGHGAFSRVLLARPNTSERLVAIKIVDLVPSGAADQARVEMTVRREIDLLGRLKSPLVIALHGYRITPNAAQLVLDYFPGGDLFTLAAEHRPLLIVPLVRRIFAELVSAVRFMHHSNVVHRDLKLENVLLRQPMQVMQAGWDKKGLLTAITDLGLAREFDPSMPDLTTRCGSEDYAAPEIVMGQIYDGRQTDAWALGVILYCMMEARLPFDTIPGLEHKMKTKVLHRICRIEWRWVLLKEAGTYPEAWNGAKRIVTNLLRSRTKRWSLDDVAKDEWIKLDMDAIEQDILDARTT